ncbi:hypothetical protein D9M68_848900 [compost metagenome]
MTAKPGVPAYVTGSVASPRPLGPITSLLPLNVNSQALPFTGVNVVVAPLASVICAVRVVPSEPSRPALTWSRPVASVLSLEVR